MSLAHVTKQIGDNRNNMNSRNPLGSINQPSKPSAEPDHQDIRCHVCRRCLGCWYNWFTCEAEGHDRIGGQLLYDSQTEEYYQNSNGRLLLLAPTCGRC